MGQTSWQVDLNWNSAVSDYGLDVATNYNTTSNPVFIIKSINGVEQPAPQFGFGVPTSNRVGTPIQKKFGTYQGSNVRYVTWRDNVSYYTVNFTSTTPPSYGQYPSAGTSFDLIQDVNASGNNIFDVLTSPGSFIPPKSFNLHPSKYSLMYIYSPPQALIYSMGGILTLSWTS